MARVAWYFHFDQFDRFVANSKFGRPKGYRPICCGNVHPDVGIVLFVVLDGIGSLWEIVTYSSRQRIGEELGRRENDALVRGSKDNPTIR